LSLQKIQRAVATFRAEQPSFKLRMKFGSDVLLRESVVSAAKITFGDALG
jgi:hypothetical protein